MRTTHNLDFEMCKWDLDPSISLFRVGTVEGQWFAGDKTYNLISIVNSQPNNGHFTDVLEWFENSCKRDGYSLRILELMNEPFKKHLIEKKGFKDIGNNNVEKTFK